jgi:hypothetical protein
LRILIEAFQGLLREFRRFRILPSTPGLFHMSLPVSFDNVPYYKGAYGGDLIVTRGVLYFFPHTDLEKEREQYIRAIPVGGLLHIAGAGVGLLIYQVKLQARKTTNHSPLLGKGSSEIGSLSVHLLQPELDARIASFRKQTRPFAEFSSSIPGPERFTPQDVKNLSLSLTGTLTLDAHYDIHDFKVGLRWKRLLRDSLWQAGFLRDHGKS